jgi:hypothetical protein
MTQGRRIPPGAHVSDAMRRLWERQARDDAWREARRQEREDYFAALKAEARQRGLDEQLRRYGAGQARRRR